MRPELKKIKDENYWVYGLDIHEFYFVIDLIEKYSDYGDFVVSKAINEIPKDSEFIDAANEVTSDLAYYNFIEKGLLWSFALWRIQGIFEAILVQKFLPKKVKKSLFGLDSKLKELESIGYSIPEKYKLELKAWGRLRNLLSHVPPEHFSPIALDKQDIEEYVELLCLLCKHWEKEKSILNLS